MVVGDRSGSPAGPEHRQTDEVTTPVAQGHGSPAEVLGAAVATVTKAT